MTLSSAFLHRGGTARAAGACVALLASAGAPSASETLAVPAGVRSEPLAERRESGPMRFRLMDPSETGVDFRLEWAPPSGVTMMGIGSAAACGGVCIGDYNGDDRPDLFLTRPFGGDRLFRNLGDFRFEDVTAEAGLDAEREPTAWGAGPVFVDIDNDGHLDLYVCSYDRPNRLYINQGDGTFTERAAEYGLDFSGASITMAFADYDLDGDLDGYLVTNYRFPEPERSGRPTSIAFRDGRLRVAEDAQDIADVLVLPSGQTKIVRGAQLDRFYRNDEGRFVDASREALGASSASENYFGHAARWFDYDADGYPDLYVSNDFYGPDQLFHNNGDGTLTDVTKTALPHIPWYSMGSDAADVNNDGRMDFMGTDMAFTTHYKSKLSMGDMADAGWFLDTSNPRQYMQNALYLNTGTPRFLEVASLAGVSSTDWSWAVKFGDLDNDGRVDLYISNGMTRNWFDSDLRQQARSHRPDAAPDDEDAHSTSWNAWETTWKDQPPLREENIAYRNLGDVRFENVAKAWGLDFEGVSFGSALGDLDGDGDLDIVTVNFEDPAHIYRNEEAGNHRVAFRLRGTRSNRMGVGAVVTVRTEDGIQVRDVASSRGFMSADDAIVHFGLGVSDRVRDVTIRWPSGWVQRVDDLRADRLYTITEPGGAPPGRQPEPAVEPMFVRNGDVPTVRHQEQPFDDYAREPLLPNRMSQLGPGIACADVNGDGHDDVYVAGARGGTGTLLLGDGVGFVRDPQVRQAFLDHPEVEEMAPLFLDADADGDADLYVVGGGVECEPGDSALQDRLFLNDGSGRFSAAPEEALPDLRASGSVAAAADFDRDGDLDLFVGARSIPGAYPATPTSSLLRNDGGRFTDATDEVAPGLARVGLVTGAVWSDADADGWPDLLVTCEWGPVHFRRNAQGRLVDATSEAGLADHRGWWNGISAGDIDRDGDIDYLVTNFGLNTKYHPHPDHPAVLYYGDMDGNGKKDIIEAKYIEHELFPVRGKSCSTDAIPALSTRFETFHQFAMAPLPDIYGEDRLEQAERFEVDTLESGVLLNDGSARFVFRALPRIAQVAPGFGAALVDVDADGHPDAYIAQNFYTPQRETVRMDGGVSQLLLGDGTGGFLPVEPAQSGLVVPGDAKALSAADVNQDGRPDLLVTVNNGALTVFENRAARGARSLQVRLRGRPGNPTAVGSRVSVAQEDGVTQTAEIYAGGGYLSQSSATLFFGLGSARAKQVEVHWPDGRRSTAPVDPEAASVTLDQPPRPLTEAAADPTEPAQFP